MSVEVERTEIRVCVVGAGVAGGIVAAELARRGIPVTVLEAGPRYPLATREQQARRALRGEHPWPTPLAALDRYTTGGSIAYPLPAKRARGVGGSSLYWEGHAIRMHASDFRMRALHAIAEDWPVDYEAIEPYYGRAERALGVAGQADDPWASPRSAPFPLPPFPFSYADALVARACKDVGIRLHHLPQARNSVPYGGRDQCRACGTCAACPIGAKASADLTHLGAAETTGLVRVMPDTSVLRLDAAGGRVREVVYAGHDRHERRLRPRIVVLAAGAVENVRILLVSASSEAPGGLANRSGALGRYFMCHPAVDVIGRIPERTFPYRIGFSTAMTRQFAVPGERARHGAFILEVLNSAGPTPVGLAASAGTWGARLREHVRREFGHVLGLRIYAEQLPDPANTVTLDRGVTDHFGSAVPRLTFNVGLYERAALEEGKQVAARILQAAGADEAFASDLTFAGHQIGTHRMGRDPHSSVVDRECRAHDVENLFLLGSGAFVTSSASPPTLTIAALALRAADRIAAELRGRG